MKKTSLFVIRTLLVLLVVIGFTSCNNNTEKLIIGKWKIVSLFVDGENWLIESEEVDDGLISGRSPFNVICTFKKDGNCTGCIRNSLFLDGKYLIDDSELRISDLSYGKYEDFEDEKYAIRLNIENLTKKALKVNGIFEVYDRNTMKIIDGYTIEVALEKI